MRRTVLTLEEMAGLLARRMGLSEDEANPAARRGREAAGLLVGVPSKHRANAA